MEVEIRDPRQSAELNEEMRRVREPIISVRNRLQKIIFGSDQWFGINTSTNVLLVPTQWEPWNRPVSTMLVIGPPGSGKTTHAEVLAHQINAKFTMIAGLGDMTPSQLVGHMEFIKRGEGIAEDEVYREGYIKIGRNVIILDEFSRMNKELYNSLAHILAAGSISVGGKVNEIAPPEEPLIVFFTANPTSSAGTRDPGDFLTDRIVAASIYRTPWHDDAHLRKIISPKEHWNKVQIEGLLEPVLTPRQVTEAQKFFSAHTRTPEEVVSYMMRLIRTIFSFSEFNWADKLPKNILPKAWQRLKNIPTEPLMQELGGRAPQHLESLARADSFLTHLSLETLKPSVQQMARSVIAHRLLYRLRGGGMDIRADVYYDDDIRFVLDVIDLILASASVGPSKKVWFFIGDGVRWIKNKMADGVTNAQGKD